MRPGAPTRWWWPPRRPQPKARHWSSPDQQGRVNFFAGLPRGRSRVELDSNLIHYKELVVTGTTASTNDECRAALDLIVEGQVDVGSLVDARFGLASAQAAFELAASGRAVKVVIEP